MTQRDDSSGDAATEPRLARVSRRAFLRTSVVGGAAAVLVGCAPSDAEVFATGVATGDDATVDQATVGEATQAGPLDPTTEPTATFEPAIVEDSPTTAPQPTATTAAEVEAEVAESEVLGETVAAPAESVVPAEMLVSFSYTPDGTGKRENPYVAVWVESPDGELVDTVALWFEQSRKGDRWLDDLRRWYGASGGANTTMSSATRVAGSYAVVWDILDLDGNPVPPGDYVVFVESARENGPHHITTSPITIGDPAPVALTDDGELHNVSLSWL